MAGIYTRDNLAQILSAGLENALRRQGERTKTENARLADNVKAINSFMKSVGYAGDDELDEKRKRLLAERAALQKAQDSLAEAAKRGDEASHEMFGYHPNMAGYSDYMDTMSNRRSFGSPTNMRQYLLELSKPDAVPAKPDDRLDSISAMAMRGYVPGSAPDYMSVAPVMPDGTVGKPNQPDYAAIMRDLMYKRSKGVY